MTITLLWGSEMLVIVQRNAKVGGCMRRRVRPTTEKACWDPLRRTFGVTIVVASLVPF